MKFSSPFLSHRQPNLNNARCEYLNVKNGLNVEGQSGVQVEAEPCSNTLNQTSFISIKRGERQKSADSLKSFNGFLSPTEAEPVFETDTH